MNLPESRFIRVFCEDCGDIIRVASLETENLKCEVCSGVKEELMNWDNEPEPLKAVRYWAKHWK